jgi:hypothetical protein
MGGTRKIAAILSRTSLATAGWRGRMRIDPTAIPYCK